MNRIPFSVPYNQDPEIILQYIKYKDFIHSLYLPVHPNIMGSGRPSFLFEEKMGMDNPEQFLIKTDHYNEEIKWIIQTLNEYGIKVFLLLNATCDLSQYTTSNKMSKLIKYIASFENLYGVVVTNLLYGIEIRKRLPHLKIKASVNAEINSAMRALYWKEFCDVDYITIDEDTTKNLKTIKQIKEATDAKLEILVNQPCLPFCATRFQHQNRTAHIDKLHKTRIKIDPDPFMKVCGLIYKTKLPSIAFINNYVTPYNLRHYKGIVDIIKLSGRDGPTKAIIKEMKQYIKGESTYSKFLKMDEPPYIFKKITSCDRECHTCNWCENTYNELVNPGTCTPG
jgi:collagenase-like PrtC family protease